MVTYIYINNYIYTALYIWLQVLVLLFLETCHMDVMFCVDSSLQAAKSPGATKASEIACQHVSEHDIQVPHQMLE